MSIAVNKNKSFAILSSPLKVEEYAPTVIENKQGIVYILQGPDHCQQSKAPDATSSRRTLSADMSSKMWLAQNGMKKTAYFQTLPILGDQNEFKGKRVVKNPSQLDIWSSILSEKSKDKEAESPPYVHPLVKRSSSSLSKKSLEICTEGLGSETGSEGFPSYQSSETEDTEEKPQPQPQPQPKPQTEQEQVRVIANYNYSAAVAARATKKPRTFPPPIPSLQMHSHRESGRLFLDASLSHPNNFFQTVRQDGRLLLTLLSNQETLTIDQETNKVFDKFQQEEIEIAEEVEGSQNISAQSLPPKSLAASGNGFEYSWGIKSDAASLTGPSLKNKSNLKVMVCSTKPEAYEEQELEVLRGNYQKHSLVLLLRGCKEFKRSLLIWEPYCIATS